MLAVVGVQARQGRIAPVRPAMAAQEHARLDQPLVLADQVGGQVADGPAGTVGRPRPVVVVQVRKQRDGCSSSAVATSATRSGVIGRISRALVVVCITAHPFQVDRRIGTARAPGASGG